MSRRVAVALSSLVRRCSVIVAGLVVIMFVAMIVTGLVTTRWPNELAEPLGFWLGNAGGAIAAINWVAAWPVVWRHPHLSEGARRRWLFALVWANLAAAVVFGLVVLRRHQGVLLTTPE